MKRTCGERTGKHWKVPQAMMVLAGKGRRASAERNGGKVWKEGSKNATDEEIKEAAVERGLIFFKADHWHEKQPMNVAQEEAEERRQAPGSDAPRKRFHHSSLGLGGEERWQVSYWRAPAKCESSKQRSGCVSVLHTRLTLLSAQGCTKPKGGR